MVKKIDLEKKEPLLLNTMPEAKNSFNSRSLFFQRKLYEKVSFSSSLISNTKPIDFWYEKPFYGRMDTNSKAIHLSERYLKQISASDRDTVFAANFVVDAYQELLGYFDFLRSRQAINDSGPYYNFQVINGWRSLNTVYHNLMQIVFIKFKQYLTGFNKEANIKDFKSFMGVFAEFLDNVTPLIPITRSKFVLTNKITPLTSGLVIDIADSLFSEDAPKVKDYLEDANFPIFKEAAQRFGFKLDKHAPWRLIADIGSPAMTNYLSNYGVKKETVIDEYFYKSHLLDLDTLKTYVIEFYNSYVSAKPIIVQPKIIVKRDSSHVHTEEIIREVQEKQSLDSVIPEQYWLRFYTFVRAREENKNWNQFEFEKIARDANHYLEARGFDTAMEYIDKKCKISTLSSRKERGFHFLTHVA